MADFPSIATPDTILPDTTRGSTIRSKSEAGYVQTRARYTRMIRLFEMQWGHLSASDFASLQTFFEDTAIAGAQSFNWTHPETSTVYICRFVDDDLIFELQPVGDYQGSLVLEEV